MNDARSLPPHGYRLCFRPLFGNARGFAFPCDVAGQVDLDLLTDAARINYLYARAMVGRDLAVPSIEPADRH